MYDWSTGAEGAPTAAASVSVVVERMYDWSRTVCRFWSREYSCFSCCWKDVRLKPESTDLPSKLKRFQLLLKGCTIEAAMESRFMKSWTVSVVVERMYDWSFIEARRSNYFRMFQLLLKGCTIEALIAWVESPLKEVSVVVERMYDWSWFASSAYLAFLGFQLLLKGCTIEAELFWTIFLRSLVSVVVERMYDWSVVCQAVGVNTLFQLLLKGCTIEATRLLLRHHLPRSFSCCWKDVRLKL